MPNATPEDTRAGFELYRSMQPPVDRALLNLRLDAAGYGPVAKRTFDHYGKLVREGYNRYIAINRFDVARASRAYENASAMARYRYLDANVGVRVVFMGSGQMFEAIGRATLVSDPGAVVEFSTTETVQGIRALRPRIGDAVSMHDLDTGRTVNGRVADISFAAQRCTVEVDFATLTSVSELSPLTPTEPETIRFVLSADADENHTADLVGRRIYYFLELLEGARSLANRASIEGGEGYTEPPILRQLRVESPVQMVVEVWPWVAGIVGTVGVVLVAARSVAETRLRWYEGTAKKHDNKAQMELWDVRGETEVAESASCDEAAALLSQAAPASDLPQEAIDEAMTRDVLPCAHHLARLGVTEIRIEFGVALTPGHQEDEPDTRVLERETESPQPELPKPE